MAERQREKEMKGRCQFHKWKEAGRHEGFREMMCLACGKRKFSPVKESGRKFIRRLSRKKEARRSEYRHILSLAGKFQRCANCGRLLHISMLDPHHHSGRAGENIFRFVFICKSLHRKVHASSKLAKEAGWLQPCYDKPQSTEPGPKPWEDPAARQRAAEMGFTCDDGGEACRISGDSPSGK